MQSFRENLISYVGYLVSNNSRLFVFSGESSNSSVQVNKLAERALLRLKQKLQGIEDGVSTTVSRQVNYLIQQARNPVNLSRLYAGWQPYL